MARKQYFSETTPLFKYQEAGTVMPADVLIDPVKLKQWMKDHPEATVTNANKQVIKDPRAVRVDPRLLKNTPKVVPAQGTIDYPASDPRSQSYTGAPATTLLMNPNQVQGEGARIIEGGNNLPILAAATAPIIVPIAAPAEGAANILFGYQGLKAAGQAVNDFRNYDYDQGLIHSGEAVLGIVPAIGGVSNAVREASPFVRNATVRAAKALGTEEGLLSNTYKINPFAFKPNPEAYYRMIGQEGYIDALESGLLRSNPGKGGLQTQQFDDVYFSMKHPWDGRNYGYVTKSGEPIGGVGYKGPYMAELTGQELNHPISSFPRANMAQSKVPISLENPGLKLYKQDWLRGYKEVPKPTNTSSVGFLPSAEEYNSLPALTDNESLSVLNDLKKRISTPEGQKRLKELGITNEQLFDNLKLIADNNRAGYSVGNTIGINPKMPLRSQTMRHELEHFIQNAYNEQQMKNAGRWYDKFINTSASAKRKFNAMNDNKTVIDKSLQNLELNRKPQKVDWSTVDRKEIVNGSDFRNALLDNQEAANYFDSGSNGREKSAMLAEVQQYMMNQGIIPGDKYVNITPEMVENTYLKTATNGSGDGQYLRLFNIMKPTQNNYKLISDNLNKMLGLTAVAGTGATTIPTILKNYRGLQQHKNGGWLNKYK